MSAPPVPGTSEPAWSRRQSHTMSKVLHEYYKNHDLFLSAEWILKVLAVVSCLAWCGVFLGGGCGGCARAAWLSAGGAALALVCAATNALMCAAAAARLPVKAPRAWLFSDIIISTSMGILLLGFAILSIVFCDMNTAVTFIHGPLGMTTAALVVGSAVVTYRAVTRRLDAARLSREPRTPLPTELEV